MELQTYSIGYIPDDRAMDILSKVGSLAFVGDIGATKDNVADFFEVSPRTIERFLKENRSDFMLYGDFRKTKKQLKKLGTDKFVGTKIPRKLTKINLFNRKHIMLFACYLSQSSDVAKKVVQYLIEAESLMDSDTKIEALLRSLGDLTKTVDLPPGVFNKVYMQVYEEVQKRKPLVSFAESVGDTENLISIEDFAKSTQDSLGLGRNKLFQEMRYDGVLNFRNMPYQNFINSGYFEVVTRVINDKCIYQTMLTGKGQIWLHTRMKKRFGI
jgi:phage antirepressor YoqD-like protein/uncharacterized protein YlbG (UPF0298 family)